MDRPLNRFRTPLPTQGTIQRLPQHKITYQTAQNLKSPLSVRAQTIASATASSEGHPQPKFWRQPPTSRNKALKLNHLISKFESLDAESLNFRVREAQPAHLHLSSVSKTETPEMGRMKMTRENLLRSFDRPGWGAETLRGLSGTEDGGPYRGFDEMDSGIGRGCYGSKIYENASAPASSARLSGVREEGRSFKDVKPKTGRDRVWSKVKDRVRFFDGSMDKHPTQISKLLNGTRADGAVASHATSQQASVTSPAVRRPQPESPQKQADIAKTPTRLGRFGRDEEPSSSSARFEGLQNIHRASPMRVSHNIDSAYARGRARQRAQYPFPTQTPPRAWATARQTNDDFEVPRTELNDRVGDLHIARLSERVKEAEAGLYMDTADMMLTSNPFLTPRAVLEKYRINETAVDQCQSYTNEKEGELRIGEPHGIQRPRRESKIQERIMLFNQESPNLCHYPPPQALSSKYHPTMAPQEHHRTRGQTVTAVRPSQNNRLRTQTPLGHAHPASPRQQTVFIPAGIPVAQNSQIMTNTPPPPPFQPPRPRTPAPRKQSQINDRIRLFESIFSGKTAQTASGTMAMKGSMSEPPLPRAKRVETWPMPTPARIKFTQPIRDRKSECISESNSGAASRKTAYHVEHVKGDRDRHRDRSREKNMQRIQARQERLHRRSRSRSRSGVNTAAGVSSASQLHQNRHFKQRQQQVIADDVTSPVQMQALATHEAHTRAKVQLILDSATHELSRSSRHRGAEEVSFNVASDLDVYGHGVNHDDGGLVSEIWVDGSDDGGEAVRGGDSGVLVVNSVVAQCELAQPKPLRLAETIRMMKLCRKGFGEKGGRGMSHGMRL